MVLFRCDGSKNSAANIRWIKKDGVHARSKVLEEWELNETITKEAALEIYKFHCGVMGYLGKTIAIVDSSETLNYYYNSTPFDDIQAGIMVASIAQQEVIAALEARGWDKQAFREGGFNKVIIAIIIFHYKRKNIIFHSFS